MTTYRRLGAFRFGRSGHLSTARPWTSARPLLSIGDHCAQQLNCAVRFTSILCSLWPGSSSLDAAAGHLSTTRSMRQDGRRNSATCCATATHLSQVVDAPDAVHASDVCVVSIQQPEHTRSTPPRRGITVTATQQHALGLRNAKRSARGACGAASERP